MQSPYPDHPDVYFFPDAFSINCLRKRVQLFYNALWQFKHVQPFGVVRSNRLFCPTFHPYPA